VIEKGEDAASIVEDMRKERDEELKKGYLDCLLRSIAEISEHAKNCGVKIGLENRFYYRELPSLEDFEAIFARFDRDTNVCYWHDTGHAQVFENLGLMLHKEYLDKFSTRLIGVHLHDIKGIINDHNAPLTGDFDFAVLKPYLRKDVIKILEPHEPATPEEIKKGLEYLKDLYE
jgi:sugar phosphate isomerase/epimerase